MPQALRAENIPSTFSITSATTAQMVLSVSSPLIANIGGQQYTSTSNLSIDFATVGASGIDTGSIAIGTYYLFLVVSSLAPALIVSLSTAPTGFSAYKQIGRVRVGINSSSAVAILDIKLESQYQIEIAEVKNNYVINGAFDFWQRGTSFTTPANGAANADRFKHYYDGAGSVFTVSRQTYSLGQSIDGNPKYFQRLQVTTAGSGSTIRYSRHAIEGVESLAGITVTLSFYASADVNRTLTVAIAQNFGTGGSPSATVTTVLSNVNITTVYTKYSVTFSVPSIAGKTLGTNSDDYIELQLRMPINTVMTVDIGQIMINDGAYAAPFVRAGGELQGELAKCQRYYEKSYSLAAPPGSISNDGQIQALSAGGNPYNGMMFFSVSKRVNPSVLIYSPVTGTVGNVRNASTGADVACTVSSSGLGTHSCYVNLGVSTAANNVLQWHYAADAEL
jgi:hypothetical protein